MITTHVLDLSTGKPAAGVRVVLSSVVDAERKTIATGVTDADGRLRDLVPAKTRVAAGTYELAFETGAYFIARKLAPFHPQVVVSFEVTDEAQHYHVPLLISPFGYTTYRGS